MPNAFAAFCDEKLLTSQQHARVNREPDERRMPPMTKFPSPNRRAVLGGLAASGAAAALGPGAALAQAGALITKPIPSSGEALPVVGIGSWVTFNVGNDPQARDSCAEVMRHFFAGGGAMIDSSPMYGSSQSVIGYGLAKIGKTGAVFSADKVWTGSGARSPAQIEESRRHWRVKRFDLMQVHNLLSWRAHLKTLHAMKEEGRLRYVGITTSDGRGHGEFVRVMESEKLDFIQDTYKPVDREVERRILPLARDKGIAVIINRPFQRGWLIDRMKRHPLPDWAAEAGAANWAEFLLKYIVSHPAVTCAIPATSRVDHVQENMKAARGGLPDDKMRRRMAAHVESL
jgi:diketogulonate reductase-like aldo/keto reductase